MGFAAIGPPEMIQSSPEPERWRRLLARYREKKRSLINSKIIRTPRSSPRCLTKRVCSIVELIWCENYVGVAKDYEFS